MAPALLASLALATTALSWQWQGARVSRVDFDAPGVRDVLALQRAFAIQPGAQLSRADIRSGVRALIATGVVEDVEIAVTPDGNGIAIAVRAQMASRVSTIAVTGIGGQLRRTVVAELGLAPNAVLHVGRFQSAVDRAASSLRRDGFPDARIEPSLAFHGTEVDVSLLVVPGAPLLAGQVQAPDSPFEPRRIAAITRLERGVRLSASRLERGRQALIETLQRAGHWEAEVKPAVVSPGESGASVDFVVVTGPKYRLEVAGDPHPAFDERALPFLRGEGAFSAPSLDQVATDVRVFYQRAGRLLARVDARLLGESDERILRLEIDSGVRAPIRAVRFPGAEALDAGVLQERIGARRGTLRNRFSGEPVDEVSLEADAFSLLATLRELGYADAKVATPRLVAADRGVAIEFPVEPGDRYRLAGFDVEGMPAGVTIPSLGLQTGLPWSIAADERSRNVLEGALQNLGYLAARVTVSHSCSDTKCATLLTVAAGERSVLDRIVIAGLVKTRRSVVDEIAGLALGEPAGPERQLEAQRRLLGLGILQSVDIHPVPGLERGPRQALVIGLTEAPSRAWSLGLAYDTQDRFGVSASWSELNAFGSGRSIGMETLITGGQRRVQINLRAPAALGAWGQPVWISFYRTEEQFTGYTSLRRGSWVDVGDRLKKPLRLIVRYEYQIVDSTVADESVLAREQRRAKINSLTPILEWDTRDDFLNPQRGVLLSAQLQSAFRFLMADAEFDRLTLQGVGFAPFTLGTLAGSVRAGWLRPRSGVRTFAPDPIDAPVAVRFFGGGRVSHRAFPTDMLGLPGETIDRFGNPLGGGGLLLGNFEWRFRLWGPVKGEAFVDGGNVWRRYTDIALGALRWGGGVGLRLETPVGPLRVEYGWKFDRIFVTTSRREAAGQFFLSFGNSF